MFALKQNSYLKKNKVKRGSFSPSSRNLLPLIQRAGEQDAVNEISPFKRGNVLRDIIDTNGMSYATLQWARQNESNLLEDIYYQLNNLETNGSEAEKKAAVLAKSDINRISAQIFKTLKVGNCGEFANMTSYTLRKNTVDQYIYTVSMEGAVFDEPNSKWTDHAFNIVQPIEELDKPVLNPKGFKDDAMVADSWGDQNPVKLKDFLARDNPYGKRMNRSEMKIRKTIKADGQETLNDPSVIKIITDVVNNSYEVNKLLIEATAEQKMQSIGNGENDPHLF